MKATVKIAFEFNETEVKDLMLQKGYQEFTREELAYELAKLNNEELKLFGFNDMDDKEIILY